MKTQLLKSWITIFSFCTGINAAVDLKEIRRILDLPEEKIDVGYVALLLSKDSHPDLDVKRYLFLFDRMAEHVDYMYYSTKNVDTLVGGINTLLFRAGSWNRDPKGNSITYDYDDESTLKLRPEALFIGELLQNPKSGTCSTLPTLWYIIADRLKMPVHMVRVPQHLFIRVEGGKYPNVEATAQGGAVSNEAYIRDFGVSKRAIELGTFMKPMTKKEFISTLLVNGSSYQFNAKKDTARAREYCELATEIDPRNPAAWHNLGKLSRDANLLKKAEDLGQTHELGTEYHRKRAEFISKLRKEGRIK